MRRGTAPPLPGRLFPSGLLVPAALLALLAGVWGGLTRLGWSLSAPLALPPAHGPLMISGFLGTVIGLERAVALGVRWALAVPAATAAGTVAQLAGVGPLGLLLPVAGSAGLVAVHLVLTVRRPSLSAAVLILGAVAWLAGNVAWLARAPMPAVAPWWAAFLVLTIAGERLELSRLAHLPRSSRTAFLLVVVLYLTGTVLAGSVGSIAGRAAGTKLAGVAMTALALWLFRHDLARYTVRRAGPGRFSALALLSGFAWLATAGLCWLAWGGTSSGPRYDVMLHSLFLGFVFAMIVGHAPIVLPAVLGRAIPVRGAFYGHLGLLHLSLGVRVLGDLASWSAARQWGGMLNAVAILLFLLNTAGAVSRARRSSPHDG